MPFTILHLSKKIANAYERLILQQYSGGSLMVSGEALRKLCTRFSIFPPFLDTLCALGRRSVSLSDTSGSYHCFLDEDNRNLGKQKIGRSCKTHAEKD